MNTVNQPEEKNEFLNWILAIIIGCLLAFLILFFSSKGSSSFDSITTIGNENSASPKSSETMLDTSISIVDQKKSNKTEAPVKVKPAKKAFVVNKKLSDADIKMAKTAWKYFENNYQKETGLFNSANKYASTTMWDTGSALAATIAAEDFGFIDKKEFDDKVTALIKTLVNLELFDGIAPNKVYNTKTTKMVNYANKDAPDGIGVSVLDLARMVYWLNALAEKHPRFQHQVERTLARWDFDSLIKDGRMYGIKRYDEQNENKYFQEGRLGYEQYAAKILQRENNEPLTAASYNNENRDNVDIYGINIATDNRTPEKYYANNSVVTESYLLDALENGIDDENRSLIENIYKVQKKRWQETGIVTAVSEDNINRKPYFIYNTIFSGGQTWVAKTSKGETLQQHKTISSKAAIGLAMLFPEDEYSKVLLDKIGSAYDPKKGWYSGIYENGEGYNSSTTANTNGVILSMILYKKYGSINPQS